MYNPNYFQAYCNMGSCYRAQAKYLEARNMYLKSISIKSDDAITEYNLANV
jgi:tetratricopeptide (TPR) repeat protein